MYLQNQDNKILHTNSRALNNLNCYLQVSQYNELGKYMAGLSCVHIRYCRFAINSVCNKEFIYISKIKNKLTLSV